MQHVDIIWDQRDGRVPAQIKNSQIRELENLRRAFLQLLVPQVKCRPLLELPDEHVPLVISTPFVSHVWHASRSALLRLLVLDLIFTKSHLKILFENYGVS